MARSMQLGYDLDAKMDEIDRQFNDEEITEEEHSKAVTDAKAEFAAALKDKYAPSDVEDRLAKTVFEVAWAQGEGEDTFIGAQWLYQDFFEKYAANA